jgi:hypothetical protein
MVVTKHYLISTVTSGGTGISNEYGISNIKVNNSVTSSNTDISNSSHSLINRTSYINADKYDYNKTYYFKDENLNTYIICNPQPTESEFNDSLEASIATEYIPDYIYYELVGGTLQVADPQPTEDAIRSGSYYIRTSIVYYILYGHKINVGNETNSIYIKNGIPVVSSGVPDSVTSLIERAKNNSGTSSGSGGIVTLDSNGRIDSKQLPMSALEYKGKFLIDVSEPQDHSQKPPLAPGDSYTNGDVYVVSGLGTSEFKLNDSIYGGEITVHDNDWLTYNGTSNKFDLTSNNQIYGISTVVDQDTQKVTVKIVPLSSIDSVTLTNISATKLRDPDTSTDQLLNSGSLKKPVYIDQGIATPTKNAIPDISYNSEDSKLTINLNG